MKRNSLRFSEKSMTELMALRIEDSISEHLEQILNALNYNEEGQSVEELKMEMVNDYFRCVLIAAQPTPKITHNSLLAIARDPSLVAKAPDSVYYPLVHTLLQNTMALHDEQISDGQLSLALRSAAKDSAADFLSRGGRPTKNHQDFVANRLGAYFVRYNGLIKRKSALIWVGQERRQKEVGAFRLFLDAALPPLDSCFSGYSELSLSRETITRKAFDAYS